MCVDDLHWCGARTSNPWEMKYAQWFDSTFCANYVYIFLLIVFFLLQFTFNFDFFILSALNDRMF